jgi:hypothetical protein
MSTRLTRRIVPKSASYTIKYPMDAPGTVFTNRGASGTVTFTLPTPARQLLGVPYHFTAVADYALAVAGAAAGDLLTKNDAAANSVTASTAGEIIGATIEAVCVESAEGTFKWAVAGVSVGHTFTVAT